MARRQSRRKKIMAIVMNMLMQIGKCLIPPRYRLHILISDADYYTMIRRVCGSREKCFIILYTSRVKKKKKNCVQTRYKHTWCKTHHHAFQEFDCKSRNGSNTGNMHVNWQAHPLQYITTKTTASVQVQVEKQTKYRYRYRRCKY